MNAVVGIGGNHHRPGRPGRPCRPGRPGHPVQQGNLSAHQAVRVIHQQVTGTPGGSTPSQTSVLAMNANAGSRSWSTGFCKRISAWNASVTSCQKLSRAGTGDSSGQRVKLRRHHRRISWNSFFRKRRPPWECHTNFNISNPVRLSETVQSGDIS